MPGRGITSTHNHFETPWAGRLCRRCYSLKLGSRSSCNIALRATKSEPRQLSDDIEEACVRHETKSSSSSLGRVSECYIDTGTLGGLIGPSSTQDRFIALGPYAMAIMLRLRHCAFHQKPSSIPLALSPTTRSSFSLIHHLCDSSAAVSIVSSHGFGLRM